MYTANSLSALTKFIPLTLINFTGLLVQAMNRMTEFRKRSVSSFDTISICTARKVRHMKRQHQRFLFLQPIFTMNGPKWSTPTFKNTVETILVLHVNLSLGTVVRALLFRDVMHLFLIDLKAFCMPSVSLTLSFCVASWCLLNTR